jgi:hypothetical protein
VLGKLRDLLVGRLGEESAELGVRLGCQLVVVALLQGKPGLQRLLRVLAGDVLALRLEPLLERRDDLLLLLRGELAEVLLLELADLLVGRFLDGQDVFAGRRPGLARLEGRGDDAVDAPLLGAEDDAGV